MNILFWNLNRNPITGYVKECLLENRVDVAVFAEHERLDRDALEREQYKCIKGIEDEIAEEEGITPDMNKIIMFSSGAVKSFLRQSEDRYAVYSVYQESKQYIFVGVHLPDNTHANSRYRMLVIRDLIQDLESWKVREHCENVVIIGDFNANPYDEEMLQADSFNAALFKDVIRNQESRTIRKKKYNRFYNPTLVFLSEKPPNYGSVYYNHGMCPPVWNCYDQILVSGLLIDDVLDMQYLRKIKGESLLNKVAPNKTISDHLPLLVNLKGSELT